MLDWILAISSVITRQRNLPNRHTLHLGNRKQTQKNIHLPRQLRRRRPTRRRLPPPHARNDRNRLRNPNRPHPHHWHPRLIHGRTFPTMATLPHPNIKRAPPLLRIHEPLWRQHPQPNRRINHRRQLPSKHTIRHRHHHSCHIPRNPPRTRRLQRPHLRRLHKKESTMFNFLTALTAVIGAVIALALGSMLDGFVPLLVPFAAGNFIYIAGSDLIPELRKDTPELKKSALQLVSLVLGVVPMVLLLLLE